VEVDVMITAEALSLDVDVDNSSTSDSLSTVVFTDGTTAQNATSLALEGPCGVAMAAS